LICAAESPELARPKERAARQNAAAKPASGEGGVEAVGSERWRVGAKDAEDKGYVSDRRVEGTGKNLAKEWEQQETKNGNRRG